MFCMLLCSLFTQITYTSRSISLFFILTVYKCQNLNNVGGNCGYCKYWKGQGYDCDWCNNGCKSTVYGNCSSERCNVEVSEVKFIALLVIVIGCFPIINIHCLSICTSVELQAQRRRCLAITNCDLSMTNSFHWYKLLDLHQFKQAFIPVLIVSQVFPTSGPEMGGTKITISGKNIGNPKDSITVKIYGVECTNVEVIRLSSV